MKKWNVTLLLLFLTIVSQSQGITNTPQFPLTDNKIVYFGKVRTTQPADKATLFLRAENWYKNNYETNDNTLIVDNSTDGVVSGTGIIHQGRKEQKAGAGDIFFTIELRAATDTFSYKVYDAYSFDKTGKYYFSDMYNQEQYPPDKPRWPKDYRESVLATMSDKINGMISTLKQQMQ